MMLAQIGKKEVLSSREYLFEPKLDGYRALCTRKGDSISFISRGGIDITSDFPELSTISTRKDCVLDGEIVIYDERGNPSFSLMQRRGSLSGKATYVVFDVLEVDGKSVTHLKLNERRDILNSIIEQTNKVQIVPSTSDGLELWKLVSARKLEGVMAKKKDSIYVHGRNSNWLKIKNELTVDCIIIGYKSKVRSIASLALGLFEKKTIKYIGQVGTGFTEKFLDELEARLRIVDVPDKNVEILSGDIVKVVPEFVCEIKYIELTKDFRLRAPVFLRLRDDKDIHDCTTEQVTYGA